MASGSKVGPEWVSISDLMSGVVGVMVVLFAVAALQITASQPAAPPPLVAPDPAPLVATPPTVDKDKERADRITAAFTRIRNDVKKRGLYAILEIHVEQRRITLRNATFALYSAQIEKPVEGALVAA